MKNGRSIPIWFVDCLSIVCNLQFYLWRNEILSKSRSKLCKINSKVPLQALYEWKCVREQQITIFLQKNYFIRSSPVYIIIKVSFVHEIIMVSKKILLISSLNAHQTVFGRRTTTRKLSESHTEAFCYITWESAFWAAASKSLAISWSRLCVSCSKDVRSTSVWQLLSSSSRSGREGRPVPSSTMPVVLLNCSSEPLLSVWSVLSVEGSKMKIQLIHLQSHTRQTGSEDNWHTAIVNDRTVLCSLSLIVDLPNEDSHIPKLRIRFCWTVPVVLIPFVPCGPFCDRVTFGLPHDSSIFWKINIGETVCWLILFTYFLCNFSSHVKWSKRRFFALIGAPSFPFIIA